MDDDATQILVTRFGEYTVAIRAAEVESIASPGGTGAGDRPESLSHTTDGCAFDLSSLFRTASDTNPRLARLTNDRGSLLIGADVRIRQVAGEALHRVPPFLDNFTRQTAIEAVVVVGDGEIAFLVDPGSLRDRMNQHEPVEGEEAS